MNKNSFMFYPEITDDDFNEKIYLKKEFRNNEIKEKVDWNIVKHPKRDFLLDPHQTFLKNYISPDTPYNGVLIFHGTGVGKTCTAISIAEGFKKTLKNMGKKILVISTLKYNFIKELYDTHKERIKKNPEDIVQCTGKDYELGEESMYLTKQQKDKELIKLKKSYYQFFGYNKFANYVMEITGGWNGLEKDIDEKIKKIISKEFDDRVIIIDEIQNIKTDRKEELSKSIQPMLNSIIKYGKNIKLILMSATPMFDRPDEIIFYLNLLLQNDGRPIINKNEIFNFKDGTLKNGAEDKLRNAFRGYISYVRAEKPFIFPFRIYPKETIIPKHIEHFMSGQKIDNNKKIQFTKLLLCPMKNIQLDTYTYYLDKKIKEGKIKINIDNKNESFDMNNLEEIESSNNIDEKKNSGILFDLTKISNIVFPISNKLNNEINTKNSKLYGAFGRSSIDSDYDNGLGGYYKNIKIVGSKKKIQYKYQSHAIFNKDTVNEIPFADEKHIEKYSSKFAKILEIIKKSRGLIFIFSQFIEQGTLPFALMLEQNGFDRECSDGEEQLLDYNANKLKKGGKRRQICYLCSQEAGHLNHHNEKSKDYHMYKRAKYILFFGESKDIIKVKKEEALRKFSSENNKYGEEIKVFIGTRSVSEGLDFKRLRQVHILEPWYNLSRHEQIIGRAIRNYSHKDLLPEERNVEIYQYATVIDDIKNKYLNRETIDLKNYRIAENKDIIIKNITRIMKESAVDCVFFKNTNIVDSNKKVKQITASGEVLNIPISDKPYSAMCDYKDNCEYKCNWMPNPRINYPVNTDTYNIRFAKNDIDIVKKHIKNIFRENIVYSLNSIEYMINNKIENIDKIYIYSALEELVNNKNEIVYDKFSRKGYIIYRGDYYVFQPFDLNRDEIPMLYRTYPSDIKPEFVDLENIPLNYLENNIESKVEVNEESLIKKIFNDIEYLYNEHIDIIKTKEYSSYIKEYTFAIIGTIIDNFKNDEELYFIKNILIKYLENSKIKYINDIINFYNKNNKLINYYSDIKFDKSKIKNNMYIGFIYKNKYYVIDDINKNKDIKDIKFNKIKIVECSKDIVLKIKSHSGLKKDENNKNNKKYNKIYGIVEFNKKNNTKQFKILDKFSQEEVYTKDKKLSKRSFVKGRICETFQINKLLEMRKKIGLYDIIGKKKNTFICENIHIYFRFKELIDKDIIWFEEIDV
jgi:superfamily II DNA or RNA helicase